MAIARSKLTARFQILMPAAVRRRLGVGPGSVVEWADEGEQIVVRRAGRYSSTDVHQSLFAAPPAPRSLTELKNGVRLAIKQRHARR